MEPWTKCVWFFLIFLPSCSFFVPIPPCPPPPSVKPPLTLTYSCTEPTVAPSIPDPCQRLSISQLVDVALQNSPQTRSAWFQAKTAAADLGAARGAYLPPVTLSIDYLRERVITIDPQEGIEFPVQQTTYGPTLSTCYLLFDFGGRNALIDSARAALDALNWIYNWEVQSVMITVIQNYYFFINAEGLFQADQQTVLDNRLTVEAAKAQRIAGIGSLADELQAETNLVQAELMLEQSRGIVHIARSQLVQSLGLPPETPICVADLPERLATDSVSMGVDQLLAAAKLQRADLAAARAAVLQKRATMRGAFSNALPSISTEVSGGKTWVNGMGAKPDNTFSLGFFLNIPIFNSFSDINALRRAQAEWQMAQASLDEQELAAFLDVLIDYYEFIANTQILKYSYKYLEIAQKNRDVALGNYQAGTRSILDLIAANNALTLARKQLVQAKTNWLTSLASLAYDTGGLSFSSIQ